MPKVFIQKKVLDELNEVIEESKPHLRTDVLQEFNNFRSLSDKILYFVRVFQQKISPRPQE